MHQPELLVWLLIFAPFLGSSILPALGRVSEELRNGAALCLVLISLFCATKLIGVVYGGHEVALSIQGINWFRADGLAVFMSLVSLLVGAVIVVYSFSYISHYDHRNEYYFMAVLFLGSMMGLVYASNLLLIYFFWEVTALASWRLIGFYRDKDTVLKADKAFLVTFFGAVCMLAGFILIYSECGSFQLAAIRDFSKTHPISNAAVILILLGILSKSATLPLHTWLPDAGVAPSPVTALLHAAVLVKIGVFVYARLMVASFNIDEVWHTVVPLIAGISALVSAGAAMVENDIKRIIAYSTVSQIGFIFLGLAAGGKVAVAGGLLYILMHGLAKGGLFLCAGIVEQKTHQKDVRQLGGLIHTMPWTALAFLFCAFSVMGIPPFGGFFGKYMVLAGALNEGLTGITLMFLLGAFLTIIYLLRVFSLVFLGQYKGQAYGALPAEGSPAMVGSVMLLAILSVAAGILIYFPQNFVFQVVQHIARIQ